MDALWLEAAAMVALSAGLFAIGLRIARKAPKRDVAIVVLAAFGFLIGSALLVREGFLLARLLPLADLVVLGNWIPLGAGLLGGLAWRNIPGGAVRRSLTIVPLACIALYAAYGRLPGSPPACGNAWRNGVCLQTTGSTCSAACAATVLKAHGIEATEAEMAALCLTRDSGTTPLGLFRGLKKKTAGTSWDVEAFSWTAMDLRRPETAPAILDIRLSPKALKDPRYIRDWGWTPGTFHTVVFFGFSPDGKIEMGDPSVGREKWGEESLRTLWSGKGFRLVRRR